MVVVFLAPPRAVFDTAAPPTWAWLLLVLVWAADEGYRAWHRRQGR